MKIITKYDHGDILYIKTDKEQLPRMVTEIRISGDGGIVYELTLSTTPSYHYEIEISKEMDVLLPLT